MSKRETRGVDDDVEDLSDEEEEGDEDGEGNDMDMQLEERHTEVPFQLQQQGEKIEVEEDEGVDEGAQQAHDNNDEQKVDARQMKSHSKKGGKKVYGSSATGKSKPKGSHSHKEHKAHAQEKSAVGVDSLIFHDQLPSRSLRPASNETSVVFHRDHYDSLKA